MRTLRAISASLLLCLAVAAEAQTTIHVPADQPTIQKGIDAASNGDTVLVAPGTYFESINFNGKNITVTSSDGAVKTIIDAGGLAPVAILGAYESNAAVLNGFTLQHGADGPPAYNGGGGVVTSRSSPTISNNIITQNYCNNVLIGGGGSPRIVNNEISSVLHPPQHCGLFGGSAVYVTELRTPNSPVPLIFNNLIENNNEFANDPINSQLGAITLAGTAIIQNNIIRNNAYYTAPGAGIQLHATAVVIHNLIYNNRTGGVGGGLYAGDVFPGSGSETIPGKFIENNTFYGNTSGTLGNSVYSNQNASEIFVNPLGPAILVNNIIVATTSAPAVNAYTSPTGYRFYVQGPDEFLMFDHNLVWNLTGPLFGGGVVDETGSYGNISADPLFINPAAGDFHLRAGSPAIDAGNTSAHFAGTGGNINIDLDGNATPQDATGKGYPILDIGAYEYTSVADAHSTSLALASSAYELGADQVLTLTSFLFSANGIPTGAVTYFEDGQQLSVAGIDSSGNSSFVTGPQKPGIHTLLATYAGQGLFTPAVSVRVVVVVGPYPIFPHFSSSKNPSLFGDYVTFTQAVTSTGGTPDTGTITFSESGSAFTAASVNSQGKGSFSIDSLSIGYHTITALYDPLIDLTKNPSIYFDGNLTSIVQEVVYPTATAISSSKNPATVGGSVTFAATATNLIPSSPIPTGSFLFTNGSNALATISVSASGEASYTTSSLALGDHTITATYVPTGFFADSSGSLVQHVLPAPGITTTTLSATPNPAAYNQAVSITATLTSPSATPLGTLNIADGATILASETITAPGWPALHFTLTGATAGTHNLSATYIPGTGATTAGSSAAVALVIQPPLTVTTLTATPSSTTSFQTVTLSATVAPTGGATGTPTGTVTFFSGATSVGSVALNSSGVARLTYNPPAGGYSVTAQYVGSISFASSTSNPAVITISRATTTLALTASPNPQVQNKPLVGLSTTLTPVPSIPVTATFVHPTGTYTIYDGSSPITNPGVTIPLTAGLHHLTATFNGDANYLPSTSPVFDEVITPQDYTLTAPPISIQAEHHAPLKITIITVGTLTDTLNLSCSNLPQWAMCYFDKSSVALNSSSSTYTATVVVDTDEVRYFARNTPTAPHSNHRGPVALASFVLGALALMRRRQTRLRLLTLLLVTAGFAATFSGCSGQYPEHTAPGTYNIQIDGITANGHLARSATVPLTITQ